MKLKKELIRRDVAGETVLIPVGKTIYEYNGMFILTEVGAFIWDLIPQVDTKEEIVQRIFAEYDAEEAEIRKDVEEFFDKLEKMGII